MNLKKYKHAFLIGVYQNPDYASDLVESLRGERSNIYIHINPRYLQDFERFIEKYSKEKDVTVIHTQPINWGGYFAVGFYFRLAGVSYAKSRQWLFPHDYWAGYTHQAIA